MIVITIHCANWTPAVITTINARLTGMGAKFSAPPTPAFRLVLIAAMYGRRIFVRTFVTIIVIAKIVAHSWFDLSLYVRLCPALHEDSCLHDESRCCTMNHAASLVNSGAIPNSYIDWITTQRL
jgi:hypothetical protein